MLTGNSHNHHRASLRGSSQVVSVTSPFKAVATVTPPVAVSTCITPTAFSYSGTLSATAAGTVRYQWIYSSGKPGPVRTVRFATAGHKTVAGATVKSRAAGGGWGEIKIISPAGDRSNKATYKILCGGSHAGITATAAVQPADRTVSCVTAPPGFTATGSVTVTKAETVTYYWALSDGANSAPAALTFTKPGTQAAGPMTIRPPAASGTGEAVLVVTSPVTAASSPAMYTLTCTASATSPAAASAGNPPPSITSAPAGSPPVPPNQPSSVTISVNAPTTATVGQPYTGTVTATGGHPPYTWGAVSALPDWMTAKANGATLILSGTPTHPGKWWPYGQATDSYYPTPQPGSWQLDLTVSWPAITISCHTGPATAGQPYLGTVTATGGDGTAFTWSVIGVPADLTGVANGGTFTISGTPTSSDIPASNPPSPGNHELYVTVSDSQTSFAWTCYVVVNP